MLRHLPAGPLIDHAARRFTGLNAPGHDLPDGHSISLLELAPHLGITISTLRLWVAEGVPFFSGDRVAVKQLLVHPVTIWPDFGDLESYPIRPGVLGRKDPIDD